MNRRRLLWLSHLLPWPPKGGLQQRSYYLMREVARHHDVRVIAFRQRAQQADKARLDAAVAAISAFATLSHISDLPEDRRIGGRRALALRSLLPGPPYTIRWGACAEYAKAVHAAVTEFRPHAVHFDTISLASYLDNIGGVPAVLNHHNIESQMLLRRAEQERHLLKRFYFWQEGKRLAAYERRVAHRFLSHLVCAELDGERLMDTVGKVPTTVVPNGVDLDYFQPAPPHMPQDSGSIVFVGGLSWYPNAGAIRFFLSKVWPSLCEIRPDIEFRIIGRNPPADIVEAARRDFRLKVLGFVDDIRPIVHRSMVYVCPIHDGGGTKLKMLDAMAMGKAIVAHPVACEGLGLEHGNNVLMAEDPRAFARHVQELLNNAPARKAIETSARMAVEERFGFDAIGKRLAQLYSSIPDERGTGLAQGM